MSATLIQQLKDKLEKMPLHLQSEVLEFVSKLNVHAETNGTADTLDARKSAGKALWARLSVQMKELEANPPDDHFPDDYSARFDEIHYPTSTP